MDYLFIGVFVFLTFEYLFPGYFELYFHRGKN